MLVGAVGCRCVRLVVVSRLIGRAVVVVVVVAGLNGACSTDRSVPAAVPVLPVTAADVSTSIVEVPPAGFCDLAVRATQGSVSMDVDVENNELVRYPGLSDRRLSMVRDVVVGAIPQVRSGVGFDTTRLVGVVNSICGLSLTPVTMTP
jgi:hypothetical protein